MTLNPYTSQALSAVAGIRHGFFTREGGVSSGIYASLNCGQGSRDDSASVAENRARVAAALGTDADKLVSLYQVHSAKAVVAEMPWERGSAPEADGVVTNMPGIALGILTADCAPILFCDPDARVIGAAHAGWRGAAAGVIKATVAAMEGLGAMRSRIVAAVGPCISVASYEVGEDFRSQVLSEDVEAAAFFSAPLGGKPHFDLPGYAVHRLARLGVNPQKLGVCTYENADRLFSYRRTQHRGEPDYGRQISAIMLA